MKKIITAIILLLPLATSASSIPSFPMTFFGNATINATSAPVGTVIRAYYGTTLGGLVNISEAGIYGYNNPSKQQLLVSEGTGTLRFTIESSAINGDIETEGSSTLTYSAFAPGEVISKDLKFTYPIPAPSLTPTPTPPPSPTPVSSGGGGGSSTIYGCIDKKAINYSSIANHDNGACVYPVIATTTEINNKSAHLSIQIPPTSSVSSGEVLGATTFIFSRNLNVGVSGADVVELQKRLTSDGFYSGPNSGYFGPLTARSVKKFQAAYGLEAVGNVGLKTRIALNQGKTSTITRTNATSTTLQRTTGYIFSVTLNVGSHGKEVTQLQTLLIAQGFLQAPVSGYFGLMTKAAVESYQTKYGIFATGSVGPLTRRELNRGN